MAPFSLQVRVLFSKGPFISIFASDPHIIIKAINQNLNSVLRDSNINGHDYMRNIVHLPVFLNSRGLSTAKKLCMVTPTNGEPLPSEGEEPLTCSFMEARNDISLSVWHHVSLSLLRLAWRHGEENVSDQSGPVQTWQQECAQSKGNYYLYVVVCIVIGVTAPGEQPLTPTLYRKCSCSLFGGKAPHSWYWQEGADNRRLNHGDEYRVHGQGSWCNWCNGCLLFLLCRHGLMTGPNSGGSLWQNAGTRSAGRRLSDSAAAAMRSCPPTGPCHYPPSFRPPRLFDICLYPWFTSDMNNWCEIFFITGLLSREEGVTIFLHP